MIYPYTGEIEPTTKAGDCMLDFLNKFAHKAYIEMRQIVEEPNFLFSNDPTLLQLEAITNYRYIHGFTRLIKKGTISVEDMAKSFLFVESSIEKYLKAHYKNKNFELIVYADIGIPAFTLTLTSYYESPMEQTSVDLDDLIEWFKLNAMFSGLEVIAEADDTKSNEDPGFEFKRRYTKIIRT